MRFLVILLALHFFMLSIAPNFQGAQLLRISALIEHYQHDSSKNNQNFLQFLIEHYANSSLPKDQDHHSLPFKSVSQFGAPVLMLHPSGEFLKTSWIEVISTFSEHDFSYFNFYFHKKLTNIFHPPKMS